MQSLANVDSSWSGINARRVLIDLARQALVNQAPELNVVIGEGSRGNQHQGQNHTQQCQSVTRAPETWGNANPQNPSAYVDALRGCGWANAAGAYTTSIIGMLFSRRAQRHPHFRWCGYPRGDEIPESTDIPPGRWERCNPAKCPLSRCPKTPGWFRVWRGCPDPGLSS